MYSIRQAADTMRPSTTTPHIIFRQAITGNGNSSKEQVAAMIQSILKLNVLPKELDATDGIAVAVCHHFQYQYKEKASYASWKDFATKNKKRIN